VNRESLEEIDRLLKGRTVWDVTSEVLLAVVLVAAAIAAGTAIL